MTLLKAVIIAVSTYSALPVPQFEWDEKSLRISICFLPVVGLICGGVLLGWQSVCLLLHLPAVLFAAVAAVLPLLITGGIHMDGYMDTCDALASHRSRERMLEIMKDSHCGAFAVIRFGIYLLLSFALYDALYAADCIPVVCVGFVLSRLLSVINVLSLPNARSGGMLDSFTAHAARKVPIAVLSVLAAVSAAVMIVLSPVSGGAAVIFAGAVFLRWRRMTMRLFGGVTGDTSGYFLQSCELMLLIGTVLGGFLHEAL